MLQLEGKPPNEALEQTCQSRHVGMLHEREIKFYHMKNKCARPQSLYICKRLPCETNGYCPRHLLGLQATKSSNTPPSPGVHAFQSLCLGGCWGGGASDTHFPHGALPISPPGPRLKGKWETRSAGRVEGLELTRSLRSLPR